ncbi:hypothetical protein [Thiohalomonas denitrificans]|uniref:Cytochrome C n=1 Tax=Thiohalomonas denitrificans TaxID=415747 RepID=A0A1G5Q048_9GAMM|nr:hypothetical protein [Thiohalomonas denitrificans]SCZ54870.1 hypothetical protein SAMN03097708_01038 [Thiohalomonas denitrificans]
MRINGKLVAICLMGAVGVSSVTACAARGEPVPNQQKDPDQRIVLELPPDEHYMVLEEMRNFVVAIQQIADGLARDDFDQVAAAAKTMGSGAANEIPPRVVNKLPETFKQLAGKVHTTYDAIELDAGSMADTHLALEQLGELYGYCVACHATYQLKKIPFPDAK